MTAADIIKIALAYLFATTVLVILVGRVIRLGDIRDGED